jgi:cyclase
MSDAPNLQEVAVGGWAWLQPNGSWGLSNSGLIVDGEQSLLVDTLFDLKRTAAMLDAMKAASPAATSIDSLVNTHANGDHCWGNELAQAGEIIASARGAAEMAELPPKKLAALMKAGKALNALGPLRPALGAFFGALGLKKGAWLADAAPFALRCFDDFEFGDITLTPPTRTFEKRLELAVGDRSVVLHEVGPAHTRGDVLVHVPDADLLYTGDILFVDAHPIVWEGPLSNWVDACDLILDLGVKTVVPGHGALCGPEAVQAMRDYLVHVDAEARTRHAAGMSAHDAALDIGLDGFSGWGEAERLVVNVATVYRHLDGGPVPEALESFAAMAKFGEALG